MRVPVRRLPQTRVSEQQQGYARPVEPLDVSPITSLMEGFRDQLLDEQDARQRVELNRRLLGEINELQSDFETRRRNPEISPIDFADNTNTAYAERHAALLAELRNEGYSRDLLDEFEGRLGTVRQGLFERGLGHQITQLTSRANEQIENIGRQSSQYATNNPDGYASARDTLLESIRTHPDLTEDQRAALEDQQLAILQDGAAGALAIQNPQFVIDTLDPQGLTAPSRTTAPSTASGTAVTATGAAAPYAQALQEVGFPPVVTAAVLGNMEVESGFRPRSGDFDGNSHGAIQWRGERVTNFQRVIGVHPNQATPQQTARFIKWEFDNPEQAFVRMNGLSPVQQRDAILNAPNAETAAELFDRYYERSDGSTRAARVAASRRYATAAAPAQTASVQTIDLPPSQARQQSDSTIASDISEPVAGLRVPGNIDLASRPVVQNADGTVSTVRTISIGTDRGEVLIPTVINGQVVSEEAATEHYRATGEHLGIFDTAENATAYAQQLHEEQARAVGVPASADISSIRTGNALIDDLNGPQRLRLLGLAREQQNRVSASQRAEMDVTIGNVVAERMNGEAGTPLPAEQEVLRVYGPIEGPQKMAQMRSAEAARPAIIGFRTQSATDIQRALDALEPDPGSPTYATELPIYQAAERAAQALLTEREQDAAAYAMRHFPSVGEAARRGTGPYYAELDRVYETLGINPASAPVMPATAIRELTEQYRRYTPAQRLAFLESNMGEMGEERFRRFVSDMEGTTAESDANIFALMRSYPNRGGRAATLFREILEGREIIAQDPARRPRSEQILAHARRLLLPAIRHLDGSHSRAIQEAVEGLYAQRNGDPVNIDRALYERSLADVLGGSLPVNMTHGRAQDLTILPPRVTEPMFQRWLERQTIESLTAASVDRRAPRYGTTAAVPMQDIIDHGVFVMTAPGRYMIKMAADGLPLGTSNGQTFRVNITPRDIVR